MTETPTCTSCRFYDQTYGRCRAHPPRVVALPQAHEDREWIDAETVWPVVSESDWCGHHQPQP